MRKTAYDDPVARRREASALGLLGSPVVRLLGSDEDGILLEEVVPGTSVADLPDDRATRALAGAMRSMWRPVPADCDLPTVEQECAPLLTDQWWPPAGPARGPAGAAGAAGPAASAASAASAVPVPAVPAVPAAPAVPAVPVPAAPAGAGDLMVPRRLLTAARAALADLLASSPEPVVLHGDLHHANLLLGPAGWVAIDPHGVTGDPAYDVGPLLLNPLERDVTGLVGRRLDLLATELAIDRERLRRWGLVRAVLACCWCAEAGEAPCPQFLRVAEVLLGLGLSSSAESRDIDRVGPGTGR